MSQDIARCCKILEGRSWVNQGQNSDMGEGAKTIPTSFMDGPLCEFPERCTTKIIHDKSILSSIEPKFDNQFFVDLCILYKL